jgi:NADH dehydrogenase
VLECDVLIVGGGFGGAYTARELGRRLGHRADRVVLVTPDNFLLFSPLLAEAASGTIEPRHAVVPLRPMVRRVHVITGSIADVDVKARTAAAVDHAGVRHDLRFQALVLAPGSVPAMLPIPGLAEEAVGFKTLPDAIWLRNRVLAQLEAAHDLPEGDLRRELLTFTFIGGGYAGVEALAELESLARDALQLYPRLRPVDLRWVLSEAMFVLTVKAMVVSSEDCVFA